MKLGAYLEDFHQIKLIISCKLWEDNQKWYAKGKTGIISLFMTTSNLIGDERHIYFESKDEIFPYLDYDIVCENGITTFLQLGKITRSAIFEKKFTYLDWLGFRYYPDKTIFRVWSPVSKEVYLVLNEQKYKMNLENYGVWTITIYQDCDRSTYYYSFRVNKDFMDTLDPYGISSNADNKANFVIDLNQTYTMQHDYYFKGNFKPNDAIIYELSVRDATANMNIDNRGTFVALMNSKNTDYGLGKIKHLGITHLQLLPIFTFGGVYETIKDNQNPQFSYNWGYNPMQYFIPSGFYTTNPNDPYLRVNELKELVDTIHELGMAVNMDVVYNHVYDSKWFPLEKLVPGYTFRTDDKGFLTDSSWCGNDIKTDHIMVRKLIVDSIIHFQKHYKIDGFRFDLMGLMDIETLKKIEEETSKNNPLTMIYGEGWNMDVAIIPNKRANLHNANQLPNIGFFNDCYRNTIKQLVSNISISDEDILHLFQGNVIYNGKLVSPNQSINYVECHDNETLYDLLKSCGYSEDAIVCYIRLALGIIIFSEGVPFIHAGMEYFRTKKGNHNSYNLGDEINKIDWHHANNLEMTIMQMIELRKSYPHFYYYDNIDIEKYVRLDKNSGSTVIRLLHNAGPSIQLIIKKDFEKETKYFSPYTTMIFDSIVKCETTVETYDFDKPGVYVFIKQ